VACPECAEYRQRAERVEEAEQLLLLFTETFSKLSRALMQIEVERDRKRYTSVPPPEGAQPVPKRRFLLLPVNLVGGEAQAECQCGNPIRPAK